jgi:hypothetical protein
MAELSIRLGRNHQSGRLEIRIGFISDEDALPMEHERRHRGLVLGLLPGLAGLEVERERPAAEPVVG